MLIPQLVFAQKPSTSVVTQKVNYSPTTPKSLRSFIQRRGKSRFWGASNLTYNGQKVWIHVYDVQKTQFAKEATNEYGQQDSGLDLFVFSNLHVLKKLSSTQFTYRRYGGYSRGGNYESVGVQTLWLDPQTKKKPIIQIAFQDPNGLYGTITNYIFAVFDSGLGKPAKPQRGFGQGASNASDWNTWSTMFEVDEQGLLVLVLSEHRMVFIRDTRFHWRDGQFKPYRRTLSQKAEPEGAQIMEDTAVTGPLDDPGNYRGP